MYCEVPLNNFIASDEYFICPCTACTGRFQIMISNIGRSNKAAEPWIVFFINIK